MFSSYMFPFYRSPFYGYPGIGPGFGFYGYPGVGYGGYGNINAIGSAISNQRLINTGTATGISQISNPSVIW